MGGRAAEEMFVGQIATGALNDLERATKIAYSIGRVLWYEHEATKCELL